MHRATWNEVDVVAKFVGDGGSMLSEKMDQLEEIMLNEGLRGVVPSISWMFFSTPGGVLT